MIKLGRIPTITDVYVPQGPQFYKTIKWYDEKLDDTVGAVFNYRGI